MSCAASARQRYWLKLALNTGAPPFLRLRPSPNIQLWAGSRSPLGTGSRTCPLRASDRDWRGRARRQAREERGRRRTRAQGLIASAFGDGQESLGARRPRRPIGHAPCGAADAKLRLRRDTFILCSCSAGWVLFGAVRWSLPDSERTSQCLRAAREVSPHMGRAQPHCHRLRLRSGSRARYAATSVKRSGANGGSRMGSAGMLGGPSRAV